MANLNLFRRKQFTPIETVRLYIKNIVNTSNQLNGYKWVHLKCIRQVFTVTQETIRHLLLEVDPEGVVFTSKKRLRRRVYSNPGPNYLWHTDVYDKLTPYGISISGCIDGFSRYIVWLHAASSCSNPNIIAGFYVYTVEMLSGCPQTLRFDAGSENTIIQHLQTFLHQNNPSEKPWVLILKSTENQRIEAWWGILRKHQSQFWINLFQKLKEDGHFTGSWLDKNLIRFVFLDIIKTELEEIKTEWNSHKIRGEKGNLNLFRRKQFTPIETVRLYVH
ncbi:unnamed protein product [Macrosiphum euphorbiae]|uniref:Integrase catalytic domain-containing protein n=1 Tax=Macrosiphum euphorbiae TaxID=13131 RepID=A0AAV0WMB1_9HEMI|nr:unnamed protein product [Macrosiphum euphorbiae]